MADTADDLITVKEARAILGVSTRKMAELIKSGKLTYERDELDGRIKLVSRSAVEALAARSKREKAA
jgi:excisionase family DNA binding protein